MHSASTQITAPRDLDPIIIVMLSEQERALIELLASGYSAKEVAGRLRITERSVQSHINRLRGKTQTRNATHMVARALETGLVAM